MSVEVVRDAVREAGLLDGPRGVVAMLSGGRDSVCLLDIAVALRGPDDVVALHLNYGLRGAASDADERYCAELCDELGVELFVRRPDRLDAPQEGSAEAGDVPETGDSRARARGGNMQAWARELRYDAAHALAEQRGALVATGHTASDQVETILYRLAASPGRRALLGMAPAEGRLVRPLLRITRTETGAYCEARELRWREDESNEDERFARARVRARVVPALRSVHPAAEQNVLRTALLLREERELLDSLIDAELAQGGGIALERLSELPAALARLVVVRLAEDAAGTYVPQAGARVAELLALGRRGGRAELHVGGLAGAVIENGRLRMVKLPPRDN